MTDHRHLNLIIVAAVSLFLPACSFLVGTGLPVPAEFGGGSTAGQPATESARRDRFGELRPAWPGVAAASGHGERPATAPAGTAGTATARRPTGTDAEPPSPAGPVGTFKPVEVSPGHFPLSALPPLAPPEPPLLAAVRAYTEGRADRAIEALKGLDLPNQEFVLAVLPALAHGAIADLTTDPRAVAVLAEQLRTAARRIEARAPLLVENVTLCRRVAGYGRYEPWPEGRPYRPTDTAQLYLEVRNLVSRACVGPQGETHLTAVEYTAEIRDAHGAIVEQPAPDDPRRRVATVRLDRRVYSRGPVDDFHILYSFPVPTTPGVYTISLELHEPASGRTVRARPQEFRVSGP